MTRNAHVSAFLANLTERQREWLDNRERETALACDTFNEWWALWITEVRNSVKPETLAEWNRRQLRIIHGGKDSSIDHDRMYERETGEDYQR